MFDKGFRRVPAIDDLSEERAIDDRTVFRPIAQHRHVGDFEKFARGREKRERALCADVDSDNAEARRNFGIGGQPAKAVNQPGVIAGFGEDLADFGVNSDEAGRLVNYVAQ